MSFSVRYSLIIILSCLLGTSSAYCANRALPSFAAARLYASQLCTLPSSQSDSLENGEPGSLSVKAPRVSTPDGSSDTVLNKPLPFDPVDSNSARSAQGSVGTPQGSFTVSNSGSAVYDVNIDVPNGGSFTPQLSLSYNSQSGGYGIAGYGFNLKGLSAITRGRKDLFHDGVLSGMTYTDNDTYFLDGKRLMLQSGKDGNGTITYTVEGDPFAKVTEHINKNGTAADTWFEVTTSDGTVCQYGNTATSRLCYRDKAGHACIASWHINKTTDRYSNYITYDYTTTNSFVRPVSITYGTNSVRSRGIINKVIFSYQSLGDNIRPFAIKDQQGRTDVCLSSITTSCNNSVYRKYTFGYDNNSDLSTCKWTRLVTVEEVNGKGDKYPPLTFTWQYLPSPGVHSSQLSVSTDDPGGISEEGVKRFMSADLNGDGIGDIVRVSTVRTAFGDETRIYVSRSKASPAGDITYERPIVYRMPSGITPDDKKFHFMFGGTSVIDYDGDGYNDLLFPLETVQNGNKGIVVFYVVAGSNVVAGEGGGLRPAFSMTPRSVGKVPIFVSMDVDGNGKDDLIGVEQIRRDNYYPCTILQYESEWSLAKLTELKLTLPNGVNKDIEKAFVGDYNNDGLSDLILLYDGGYKIYFNNGGTSVQSVFTEDNTKAGTDFGNCWRIQQGDFDGDGLSDFVYNKAGETCLWIAHNNGNGTFSCTRSADTGISDQSTNKDNERFSLMACDIDHDGLTDVMVCKAGYRHRGGFKAKNVYRNTQVRWLCSTGTTLKVVGSYTKNREDDALESSIFIGDFDGDGYPELANYGSTLNSTDNTFNEKINIYKSGYDLSTMGKITGIHDGMDNHCLIQYAFATSPAVYKKNVKSSYPVNTYTLPLSVVRQVMSDNGAAGRQTTRYFYEDLRLHIAGRGLLGFNTVTAENTTLGTKVSSSVDKWDEVLWIPAEIRTSNSVGNNTSTAVSTYSVSKSGKNYFAYVSKKDMTDLDGNTVTTLSNYDVSKGVIIEETVKNDGDNMYKKAIYSGYQNKGGVWLPTSLTMTQKHADDATPYTTVTTYSYDDKGNVLSSTVNSGTSMALKTTSTYDAYGNVLSSVTTGNGVKVMTRFNDYDPSGCFVIKSYTSPASAINTFTYDLWGNLLTESDATEPSNVLTTKYTYDGWGRKQTALKPDGTLTTYDIGWGMTDRKKYYSREATTGKPPVTTWYDKGGHEVLQETFGAKGMPMSKTITYNDKGQVSRIESKTGKLTVVRDLAYDDRGRVVKDAASSGKSVSYSYGNRSVVTTIAGRTYTKTTDAWGNVVKSTDPVSEVEYRYSSIGKPSSVRTQGSIVSMTYDAAGNQLSLSDPDAGTSYYTYAADGTLLTQTDGRGIKTTNSYDNLGRLASAQIGQKNIVYTYGTAGNEKLRLVKLALGNNSIEYTHDRFGRVITEKHNVDGRGTYGFSYAYNSNNQLAKTIYPGGLEESYTYDGYGFKSQSSVGDKVIYKLESTDGLVSNTSFMGKLTTTLTRDARGYESNRRITRGSSILENFDEIYDGATGNLLSRKRNNEPMEYFGYDNMYRLVSVKRGDDETMRVSYAPNGNILFKTGVGNFFYDKNVRPHAVTEVENADGKIPGEALTTSFNDFGKIELIDDAGKNLRMDIAYGPDRQRWYSELSKNGTDIRTTVYAGEYEKVTENGKTREFYYLDGNTIAVRENGTVKTYLAFTDNLGSILSVMDENGAKVFDASYDAWGKQTVTLNSICLHRGYTGHEMLNEFDIINMNGRLYDPVLGRFFSPDNYVQMPDNSQNFNRYSYCLNNPLKYSDPSGEFAWSIPVIAGAMIGAYAGASIQSGTAAFWKWNSNAWKGAITGGIVGATIGYGVSAALASSGVVTGLTTTIKGTEVVTRSAGITSSILNSGSINIVYNAITGGDWDNAWKAGIAGLVTGAWAITGGFGMTKCFKTTSNIAKLAKKLGYQMIGTVGQSVGDNWAKGRGLFSKITLGVGPVNLTIGKGQRLLQWENNLGNIAINAFGLVNTVAGGKVHFNADDLTFEYSGGLMDVFQPPLSMHNGQLYYHNAGFSPYTVTGNSNLGNVLKHELHHLWHSRALNDLFLANYGLQGLYALILKGNFVANKNYYEDFVDYYSWWPLH